MADLKEGDFFHSWCLQGILNAEIAAGNTIAKTAYSASQTVIILETPYMSPIRESSGNVVYEERDIGADVFKMSYRDTETNEILACFLRKDIIAKLGGGAIKRIKKTGKWFKDEVKRIKHDTVLK